MTDIWMGIAPERDATRVVAMAGPSETILKARLARAPMHPRAMATLIEAIALWQGSHVRAALCAAESGQASDSSLFREAFTDAGSALYTLEWVPPLGRRRRHRDLRGVGAFGDLRQLVLFEVAR